MNDENTALQLKRCADALEHFDTAFQELQKLRDQLQQDDPYDSAWLIGRLNTVLAYAKGRE